MKALNYLQNMICTQYDQHMTSPNTRQECLQLLGPSSGRLSGSAQRSHRCKAARITLAKKNQDGNREGISWAHKLSRLKGSCRMSNKTRLFDELQLRDGEGVDRGLGGGHAMSWT